MRRDMYVGSLRYSRPFREGDKAQDKKIRCIRGLVCGKHKEGQFSGTVGTNSHGAIHGHGQKANNCGGNLAVPHRHRQPSVHLPHSFRCQRGRVILAICVASQQRVAGRTGNQRRVVS